MADDDSEVIVDEDDTDADEDDTDADDTDEDEDGTDEDDTDASAESYVWRYFDNVSRFDTKAVPRTRIVCSVTL